MTSPTRNPFSADQLAYPFRQFCRLVGIGVTTGYAEVRRGRLRVVKSGRKTLVLAPDGAAWLDTLPEGTDVEPKSARRGHHQPAEINREHQTQDQADPEGRQQQAKQREDFSCAVPKTPDPHRRKDAARNPDQQGQRAP